MSAANQVESERDEMSDGFASSGSDEDDEIELPKQQTRLLRFKTIDAMLVDNDNDDDDDDDAMSAGWGGSDDDSEMNKDDFITAELLVIAWSLSAQTNAHNRPNPHSK